MATISRHITAEAVVFCRIIRICSPPVLNRIARYPLQLADVLLLLAVDDGCQDTAYAQTPHVASRQISMRPNIIGIGGLKGRYRR